MICQKCNNPMEFKYSHLRGRHEREYYYCKKCNLTENKKIRIIPNKKNKWNK